MISAAKRHPSLPSNIAGWLASSQLGVGREITGVSVRLARRVSALVALDDGSSLFLKEFPSVVFGPAAQRELDLLDAVRTQPDLAAIHSAMPDVLAIDVASRILVTRGLTDRQTFRDLVGCRPPTDDRLTTLIAERLAQCHDVVATAGLRADTRIRPTPCPVLDYDNVTPTDFSELPGTQFRTFLAAVQAASPQLAAIRDRWSPSTFIHGDVKDDNFLIRGSADDPDFDVALVDWEFAGWGDPCWDLGCFVGIILIYWLDHVDPESGPDLNAWIAQTDIPFDDVRLSCRNFVAAYLRFRNPPDPFGDFLAAVAGYAGIFLLHRAQTSLELHGVLTIPARLYLHVGLTIIENAPRLATFLFGER